MLKKYITICLVSIFTLNGYSQKFSVGDTLPDFEQAMITGETFKLSSLKGQMVLVDFWASWCGPCRKETPYLIEAFNKYKDAEFKNGNGFTIVSVSLDGKKEKWVKAVEDDNMIWPIHTSDLRASMNKVSLAYGIKSVPASYLINGDGIIVAVNLRGKEVEAKLKKLKKGFFNF